MIACTSTAQDLSELEQFCLVVTTGSDCFRAVYDGDIPLSGRVELDGYLIEYQGQCHAQPGTDGPGGGLLSP